MWPSTVRPGGRLGTSLDSVIMMSPSITVTSWERTGSLAGGASTLPVRRLNLEAWRGDSTHTSSTHPAARAFDPAVLHPAVRQGSILVGACVVNGKDFAFLGVEDGDGR